MLDYGRKQAPHEQVIIRQCLKSGKAYPKAIANAPVLDIGNELYFFAFDQLDTCRLVENGPIPYVTIKEYGLNLEMDDDQLDRFIGVILDVDKWFMEEIQKDIAEAIKKAQNG